jgi:hypothetical protein
VAVEESANDTTAQKSGIGVVMRLGMPLGHDAVARDETPKS